jgi:hypothetical protein
MPVSELPTNWKTETGKLGTCLVEVGRGFYTQGHLLDWQGGTAEVQLSNYHVRFTTPASMVYRPPDPLGPRPADVSGNSEAETCEPEQETGTRRTKDQKPAPPLPYSCQPAVRKKAEELLDLFVTDLFEVEIGPGQLCFFLEFGESSELAYVKPVYEEDEEEEGDDYKLDTAMLEAFILPGLRHPPSQGQVLSAPRSYANYVKFIRFVDRI